MRPRRRAFKDHEHTGSQLSFKEAVKLPEQMEKPDLGEDELIMLVLGILDKPIQGKVVLQNEVFLFYQELKEKLRVINPDFTPTKNGPFSSRIADLVELLEDHGFIKIRNKRYRRLARYFLTEMGKKYAQEVIEKVRMKLGDEYVERLRRLRQGLDELGHDGILEYIHQYYPHYTTGE